MSHEEPRRVSLPSRLGDVAPASSLDYRAERYAEPPRREPIAVARRASAWEGFGRAIRRHWWQILPLWLAATALIWFLLPRWLPNSYEAYSDLLFDAGAARADFNFDAYKQTQERRVGSPTVIAAALERKPDLAARLVTPDQLSPIQAIQRGLSAVLHPKTDLIRVAMTAPRDDGLAQIVDEVIQAYLAVATDFSDENAANRKVKLQQLTQAKDSKVRRDRDEVKRLVGKNGNVDAQQGRNRHAAAIESHSALTKNLLEIDLKVVAEQARLEQARRDEADQARRPKEAAVPTEADAVKAFYRLPEVKEVEAQLAQAQVQLVKAKGEAGKAGDANRSAIQKRINELQVQKNGLWEKHSPILRVAAAAEFGDGPAAPESSRIEAGLNALKAQQARLNQELETIKAETLAGGSDVLALDFARQDLDRDEAVLKSMTQSFQEAEVGAAQPVVRVRQEFAAQTIERSAARERWAVGIAGPALILLTLLGFFSLVERRVGRILDPADLPSRARLNVIGLVPPLPKGRGRIGLDPPAGGGKPGRSEADLERFIQSLDQLRVLVCGRGDASGRPRRSLLITSATEGEGKSTLAAQLAERSVSAGLLTLLVDADLRNPTLSRMFDRPESVGLANVLRGELMAEEAIGTVTEAGGFHFLAAGQVRDDLSRLLASDRLARLLESARESFDLVLVDSPPVLPVADALTIGQWVDGAVLTVRHKSSRLPLVERAAQQLSSVGVTVLGAVVNGIRDRYAPSYGPRPEAGADRSAPAGSSY